MTAELYTASNGQDVEVECVPNTPAAWARAHGILSSVDRLAIDAARTGNDWTITVQLGDRVTVTAAPANQRPSEGNQSPERAPNGPRGAGTEKRAADGRTA